jgi:N6-adenosine-specific RNA methylase IME4
MGKKFKIIYADPPWTYRVWTAKGGHKSASAHYDTMSVEDICSLPIQSIADNDCVLFLWATYPNLPEALEVIKRWGFVYKTVAFTWVKMYKNGNPVFGLGYWTRANAELCILATKGKPKRVNKGVSQVVLSPQEEHSKKPDEVRDRIVTLMGDLPRIELFARKRCEGWTSLGLEIDGSDIRESLNFERNFSL